MAPSFPIRRQRGLLIRKLSDELLVYDTAHHEAHCLNEAAALVWNECDGATSPAEIARRIGTTAGLAVDEDVVSYALDLLERFRLLEEPVPTSGRGEPITRRDLVQRVGLAASAALPLISSIVAPVPAQAQTAGATGPTGATGETGETGATGPTG
jgi:hypothetical protein